MEVHEFGAERPEDDKWELFFDESCKWPLQFQLSFQPWLQIFFWSSKTSAWSGLCYSLDSENMEKVD